MHWWDKTTQVYQKEASYTDEIWSAYEIRDLAYCESIIYINYTDKWSGKKNIEAGLQGSCPGSNILEFPLLSSSLIYGTKCMKMLEQT